MGGIPLGRIAGFVVTANWSVLVILWLFTWSLASTLPNAAPGYSAWAYWLAGACGALVLLGSLLAHELTHAVFARSAGVEVHDVTLWLFGGVTRLAGEAKTPKAAFRIAASGPLTSMILGVIFAAAAYGLRLADGPRIVVGVGWWLAGINVLLSVFNLLPGAPLDGGRVLRAILWQRYGDPVRAGVGAARAGRVLALILIVLGLMGFLAGALIGGVWMAFIGWFIFAASRDEEAQLVTQQAIADVRVSDVMTAHPNTAPPDITIDEFVQRYLLGDRHSAYPVTERHGAVTGLITLAQLRRIAPNRRAVTLVRDAAIPLAQVVTAAPDERLTTLLERLRSSGSNRALIFDAGQLIGIVTASDLNRLIDVYQLAPQHSTRTTAPTPGSGAANE
ncbi:Zn-dependent protease/CBS domain-containing protein [Mycobacterium frederiksbergense]|uniref:Zinc metalloprotease n=1 Tax=Mycolicibacterium frederiksbergense TaxID=117567 RepID=A0ABT6KTP8_9MYCO|nr:site-2 protease family protein [Mycolicibacterium frederiksbergense]MDH6194029.1 Zn-dependent protease/CBS domain-containing protein [Mycolicibacterium frederiksbergense]